MNIHYFKHVPFEGLGCIDNWARMPEHRLSATKFYEDYKLPFVDICDLLIVMGGPMSVNEKSLYPWLTEEKKFIEKALAANKKVLGICLGAQLIADVLGVKVYPNKEKEIGWFPVQRTTEGKKSSLFKSFSDRETVFHWHGETFDLPKGAQLLASSEGCVNQAFLYGNNALGLQFHLEMTSDSLPFLIEHCKHEITDGKYIQKESELLNKEMLEKNNVLMGEVLETFVNL